MARRKEVFQSKVLQRLFPAAPKYDPSPPWLENPSEAACVDRKASRDATSTGNSRSAAAPTKRLFTVLPPPADYKAESQRATPDKDTAEESRDDADGDSEQDGGKEQKSRKRKRRKKRPDGAAPVEAREGGEGVSKNKKRKLKKKRRKEKLLSMGLTPRAAAVEFTYRREQDGDDGSGGSVAEVCDFLRSTMKLYMSESSLPVEELRLRSGTVEDLLSSIAGGGRPSSVLKRLSALQTFVQRRETAKLEEALKELHNAPTLSAGEAAALDALFHYWITDVLSARGAEEAGGAPGRPSVTPMHTHS